MSDSLILKVTVLAALCAPEPRPPESLEFPNLNRVMAMQEEIIALQKRINSQCNTKQWILHANN